jgi:ubiquinone/menaquinone biosynthesis C-methylase UbiE
MCFSKAIKHDGRMWDKKWEKFYDKTAANRENAINFYPTKIIGKNDETLWIKVIKSKLKNEMKLLEIGCGTGLYLRKISKLTDKKIKMIGIDISPKMIKIAKKKSHGLKKLEFLIMDAYKTKFKNNYFDIVINHLGAQSYDEVFRILKKDGYYILLFAEKGEWKEMINLFGFKNPIEIGFHINKLKKSGFKIIQIKKCSFTSYFKDIESLTKILSIIPFNPLFNRKKHIAKLKKYAKTHMTCKGIKSTHKRVIIICKKPDSEKK